MIYQNVIENYSKYDLMRGIAAFIVLFSHAVQIFVRRLFPDDELMFTVLSTLARHAVLVFFLLSGYLITNSIISNIRRNQYFDVTSYLAARITRIYPPLIGSIIIVFTCWIVIYSFDLPGKFHYGIATDTFVMREKFAVTLKDIYLVLTMQNGMLQANGPLWSLYLECIIYIIAMFGALCIMVKSKLIKSVFLFFAIYLCFYGFKINANFWLFILVWSIGSVLNVVNNVKGFCRAVKSYFLPKACLLFLMLLGLINWKYLLVTKSSSSIHLVAQLLFCILYAWLIFLSTFLNNFKSKYLVDSGGYSYSLYIIHFPLLLLSYSITQKWISSSLFKTIITTLFTLVITVLLARIFAKYFENQSKFKPFVIWVINVVSLNLLHQRK